MKARQRIASRSHHLPRARCTIFPEHRLLTCLLRFLSRPAANHIAAELDYKLLLSIQYQCNMAGIVIPWDDIAVLLGPNITGSAVIQHLAKTRSRMAAKGHSVPPPLRRGGGGSRFSTAAIPSSFSNPTAAPSAGPTTNAPTSKKTNTKANKNSTKSKKAGKKASQYSEESDEDDDAWDEDDSDAEYGEPRAKRAKTNGKGSMKRKVKTEDSDEDAEIAIEAAKPKTKKTKSSSGELSPYGYTDINGVPIDDDIYSDGDTNTMVGAGYPGLGLDNNESHPITSNSSKKSLILSNPTTPMGMDTPVINTGTEEEALGSEFGSFVGADMHGGHQLLTNDLGVENAFPYSGDHVANSNNRFNQVEGAYGNDGGFSSNMGQAATYPTIIHDGGFNNNLGQAVPYPVQTSWPNSYGVASSSNYTSVNQTPAGTSAGADYVMNNFDDSEYNFQPSFDNSGYDLGGTGDLFNADNVDGNYCDGDFFSGNYYGN